MKSNSATEPRQAAIDEFRGLAIVLMVLANYAADVQTIPPWLKHAPDVGLTVIDLIAPMFIFAIGLTFATSASRRAARDGFPTTLGHFIRRFLAMIGIGAIISAGETALGVNHSGVDWGVLQAIGSAGLITLPAIFLSGRVRLLIGLALLTVYQLLIGSLWLGWVLHSPHGGLGGTLSWAAMLLLATVAADLYQARPRLFPPVMALTLIAGLLLGLFAPVSKNRVSASYDLISLGASGLVFSLFYLTRLRSALLTAWGRNPLLLYVLHYLLLALVVLPDIPEWHTQAPLWLAGLQAATLISILSIIAVHWHKKGFVFSL